MPVLNNFEQDGTFLGIKRYKVIKDEQLTTLNLLELSLKCTFDFGNLQCAR